VADKLIVTQTYKDKQADRQSVRQTDENALYYCQVSTRYNSNTLRVRRTKAAHCQSTNSHTSQRWRHLSPSHPLSRRGQQPCWYTPPTQWGTTTSRDARKEHKDPSVHTYRRAGYVSDRHIDRSCTDRGHHVGGRHACGGPWPADTKPDLRSYRWFSGSKDRSASHTFRRMVG